MSSLIPGAEHATSTRAQPFEPSSTGGGAVAVGMDDQLGAAAKRVVGDGVHVADDHVGLHPGRKQRVCASVHADDHRLEVAHVRPDDREIALVAGATGDDQRVALPEPRLERREIDALGQQAPLLAQVAERVLGEPLERLGHPALLLRQRPRELVRVERAPVGQAGAVAEDARTADADVVAVAELVEERRARSVDQPHAAAHEQQRPRIREAAGLRAATR